MSRGGRRKKRKKKSRIKYPKKKKKLRKKGFYVSFLAGLACTVAQQSNPD